MFFFSVRFMKKAVSFGVGGILLLF